MLKLYWNQQKLYYYSEVCFLFSSSICYFHHCWLPTSLTHFPKNTTPQIRGCEWNTYKMLSVFTSKCVRRFLKRPSSCSLETGTGSLISFVTACPILKVHSVRNLEHCHVVFHSIGTYPDRTVSTGWIIFLTIVSDDKKEIVQTCWHMP